MDESALPEKPGLPWENRRDLGFFPAMMGTLKGVLLEPAPTFRDMRRNAGIGDAVLYTVFLGTVGGVVGLAWQALVSALGPVLGFDMGQDFAESMIGLGVLAVLMPALVILGAFIVAGVVHLCALAFGAGQHGFEVTFKVVAYAQGSTAILQVVPIFGGIVGFVWALVVSVIGMTQAQETSGGRAAGAVLAPVGLCCVCWVFALIVVIATAGL
ncbi:YIP1 family protein [Myxococcota bacterium]